MKNNLKDASLYFKEISKTFHLAKARALQEIGQSIRSKAVKGIASEIKLQQKKIRDNVRINIKKHSEPQKLILRLSPKHGKMVNFTSSYFLNRKPKQGPSVDIKGERKRFPHAFYRKGAFGEGLFVNEHGKNILSKVVAKTKHKVRSFFGKKKKMIEVYTTVTSDIGKNNTFNDTVINKISDQYMNRFFHHLDFYINRDLKK